MISVIQPAPTAPADTRTPTVRDVYSASIALLSGAYAQGMKIWKAVWGTPNRTPAQACSDLATGGVAAFGEYLGFQNFIASLKFTAALIDPTLTGTLTLPGPPPGWTYTSTDGQTVTVTPPPATVPTGLAVIAATAPALGQSLSWTPVTGATSYTIQRSEDGGTTLQTVRIINAKTSAGGQVVTTPAVTTWLDVDALPAGTQYQISASTPAGTSAFSAAVTL
jgi:hypothetical protein